MLSLIAARAAFAVAVSAPDSDSDSELLSDPLEHSRASRTPGAAMDAGFACAAQNAIDASPEMVSSVGTSAAPRSRPFG